VAVFNIVEHLKQRKSLIDRTLEQYLARERPHYPESLYQAMHYGVFSGGKRLRPILTLATGDLFGAERKRLLPFACSLELIHTYSIIHDDLPALDNDDLRRGRLASHKVFGEGIALLAGDALLTEAFHLMSRPELLRGLKPSLIVELIHEISHAAGAKGMVGGQAIDLESEGREVPLDVVESIHGLKTGALIFTAARVGARIAGATATDLRRISRYGKFLGLAFQITDDISDTEGQNGRPLELGKCDKEKRKATYPSIVGLPKAKARVRELVGLCLKEVELFGKKADPLRGIACYVMEQAMNDQAEAPRIFEGSR
jgi:geranylgeranyl diphosphate synthase type II